MGDHDAPQTLLRRWRDTEPLRLYLYGITVPVLGVACAYGWVTTEQLGAWLAVAAALFLGSALAGELARTQVTSPATVDQWLNEVHADSYARGVHDALHTTPDDLATREMAVTTADRCRNVDHGQRCRLLPHGEGTPHRFD